MKSMHSAVLAGLVSSIIAHFFTFVHDMRRKKSRHSENLPGKPERSSVSDKAVCGISDYAYVHSPCPASRIMTCRSPAVPAVRTAFLPARTEARYAPQTVSAAAALTAAIRRKSLFPFICDHLISWIFLHQRSGMFCESICGILLHYARKWRFIPPHRDLRAGGPVLLPYPR